jgi:hypothetical protein
VDYSTANPAFMPNYERWGQGAQVQYDTEKFTVGMIYFGAKDKENEALALAADSLGILPMQNTAFSWNIGLKLVKNMTFTAEYGLSILTRDVRTEPKDDNFIEKILGAKTSTAYYNAFNARLNYQLMKNTIGIAYEQIVKKLRKNQII